MDFGERVITSLTVLITGFVVVFAVLILLILLISVYGTIVSKAQKAAAERKAKKEALVAEQNAEAEAPAEEPEILPQAPVVETGLTTEVVAVIAAAVDAMYGEGAVKVKSIKKVPQSRPVWSTAGILDNTRPF